MQNRKAQTWLIVLGVFIGIPLILGLLVSYWPVFLAAGVAVGAFFLIRHVLMRRYFGSEEFLAKKAEIQSVVAEHNDVKEYVSEIRASAKV